MNLENLAVQQSDRLWSAQYRRAEINVMVETKMQDASEGNILITALTN